MTSIDILTYGTGYPHEIYDRFIGTLFESGFEGNLYLIISKDDQQKLEELKKQHKNIYTFIDSAISVKKTHINNHRFFVMKYLLNSNKIQSTAQYIFITDFRDVLFQKNISKAEFNHNVDIYGFQENIKINNDLNCNTLWILLLGKILNEEIYEELHYRQALCCGTTLIKNEYVKKYINMMCDIIEKNKIELNLDQGIHNYILYLNKLNCTVHTLTNFDNFVNTVGSDIKKINEDNLIVNSADQVSYVVHQYDRMSEEQKILIGKKYNNKYNFIL